MTDARAKVTEMLAEAKAKISVIRQRDTMPNLNGMLEKAAVRERLATLRSVLALLDAPPQPDAEGRRAVTLWLTDFHASVHRRAIEARKTDMEGIEHSRTARALGEILAQIDAQAGER